LLKKEDNTIFILTRFYDCIKVIIYSLKNIFLFTPDDRFSDSNAELPSRLPRYLHEALVFSTC